MNDNVGEKSSQPAEFCTIIIAMLGMAPRPYLVSESPGFNNSIIYEKILKLQHNHGNIDIILLLTYLDGSAPRNSFWPIPSLLAKSEQGKSCFNKTLPIKYGAAGENSFPLCAGRGSLWDMALIALTRGLTGGVSRWL